MSVLKYNDSKNCKFFEFYEVDTNTINLSSFLVISDEVKFDLSYGGNTYFVRMKKIDNHWLCEGNAVRKSDGHVITCTALLIFDEEDVEIHGIKWNEDGINYKWSAFISQ